MQQLMKRRAENPSKIPMFLAIDFIKIQRNSTKNKVSAIMSKKYQNKFASWFWQGFFVVIFFQNFLNAFLSWVVIFFDIFWGRNMPIFETPDFWFAFPCFHILMIISIDLDPKPYLRYWNFALTSIPSSNWGCDRFPSEFSKNWFQLEGNCTFSR